MEARSGAYCRLLRRCCRPDRLAFTATALSRSAPDRIVLAVRYWRLLSKRSARRAAAKKLRTQRTVSRLRWARLLVGSMICRAGWLALLAFWTVASLPLVLFLGSNTPS